MNEVTYSEDSLTISNVCPECIAQEQLCVDCVELADARLTDKAYALVDEGNLQYKRHWFLNTEPSGHDWTEREGEYKDSTVQLQDGGVLDTVWELDDERQRARETECKWCHLMTPKHKTECQSCDKELV
jgi:hypothetical protein